MAKKKEAEREIRWNARASKDNPEYVKWWVLFVNEKREIESQEMKLYRALQPIVDEREITSGSVAGVKGLSYKLVSFDSRCGEFPFQIYRPYKGKISMDTRLYDREKADGLANLTDREFSEL